MLIRLTKISDAQHRLEIVRDDGSTDARTLDTRSFLVHDLAHYSVESEAQLRGGFWGSLAAGASFDDLSPGGRGYATAEGMRAEGLAAPFQTLWNERLKLDDERFAVRRLWYMELSRMSEAFVDGALERMRKVWGHWKATPFGATMEIRFPPA